MTNKQSSDSATAPRGGCWLQRFVRRLVNIGDPLLWIGIWWRQGSAEREIQQQIESEIYKLQLMRSARKVLKSREMMIETQRAEISNATSPESASQSVCNRDSYQVKETERLNMEWRQQMRILTQEVDRIMAMERIAIGAMPENLPLLKSHPEFGRSCLPYALESPNVQSSATATVTGCRLA